MSQELDFYLLFHKKILKNFLIRMDIMQLLKRHLFISMLLGIVIGGIVIVISTKALPKIITSIMQKMMEKMKESGCDPKEM